MDAEVPVTTEVIVVKLCTPFEELLMGATVVDKKVLVDSITDELEVVKVDGEEVVINTETDDDDAELMLATKLDRTELTLDSLEAIDEEAAAEELAAATEELAAATEETAAAEELAAAMEEVAAAIDGLAATEELAAAIEELAAAIEELASEATTEEAAAELFDPWPYPRAAIERSTIRCTMAKAQNNEDSIPG